MSILMDRIELLLYRKGATVAELERNVGLGNGTIRLWAKRESPNPRLDTLTKIAEYFSTTVSYLLGETDSVEKCKLISKGESEDLDSILPVTHDEITWIKVIRFVSQRNPNMSDIQIGEILSNLIASNGT